MVFQGGQLSVKPTRVNFGYLLATTPLIFKQSIFDPRPENCLSFSKKSPQKIVWILFSRWSINFYRLNIQTF